MRRLIAWLARLDAAAWKAGAMAFLLFGGVGLALLFGATALGLDGPATARRWLVMARGPWGLPAAVAAFALLAFLGVPQFVLIAAAVVAFGPWEGALYSWIGTMVSATVGFALGRALGARALRGVSSEGLERFMAMIGRNGFQASAIVRLVPFAPFVVVNMAAGVTPMRTLSFAAGTALGIVPKIALTAFAGDSALRVAGGGGLMPIGLLTATGALWLAAGLAARRWLKR
ncbi:MAG TPA: TVP38/TMEM64 family protein [Caulobacteraceae bacterium]|nr:TVP38/TMEM64 family protein [Caulobacteraceae bacterium]